MAVAVGDEADVGAGQRTCRQVGRVINQTKAEYDVVNKQLSTECEIAPRWLLLTLHHQIHFSVFDY